MNKGKSCPVQDCQRNIDSYQTIGGPWQQNLWLEPSLNPPTTLPEFQFQFKILDIICHLPAYAALIETFSGPQTIHEQFFHSLPMVYVKLVCRWPKCSTISTLRQNSAECSAVLLPQLLLWFNYCDNLDIHMSHMPVLFGHKYWFVTKCKMKPYEVWNHMKFEYAK